MTRDQWRNFCEREIGKPYIWGAEGPDAYDCSGFAQWALRPLGLDPPSDQTAAGLFRFFRSGRSVEVDVAHSDLGDLVFFGTDESITHIGLAWGGGNMLEAGGGGRRTTSVAVARAQGAEVRIRPIARRSDLAAILRPSALSWPSAATRALAEALTGHGHYTGEPPLTEWLGDGRHMQLKQPFGYVEQGGREWPVPAETIVDGASIPQVFWSLIGGPFEGKYRNASVVHDYYCDIKARPWQQTHRIFYEAMLCSGVSTTRAKVMYYGVYRFGPRWTEAPAAVAEAFGVSGEAKPAPSPLPTERFDAESFKEDASLISARDLGVDAIEDLANLRRAGIAGVVPDLRGAAKESASPAMALESPGGQTGVASPHGSLLERLVAMEDAATDWAAGEAIGALLARYTSDARVRADDGMETPRPAFEDLKATYETLYGSCEIRPERAGEVAWYRKKLTQYRPRYEAVSARTGVPWWFIGVVHALEASFNFYGHLHNGDPLSAKTVQVPANRPPLWNPPNDWESSAIDALTYDKLVGLEDWSVPRALHRWEGFNGFGYYAKNIHSPYLWSFSNHYTKGKFVADRKYDGAAVSKQCGAAVMLLALERSGLVDIAS